MHIHSTCIMKYIYIYMLNPYFARVKATFRRLGSFRKPIPWCSLERTQERMMKSFSLPWKASTLATSISYKSKFNNWELSTFCLGSQAYSCRNNLSKRADTNDGDYLIQFLVQRSTVLHVLYNVGSLALIRSDDTYLLRLDVGSQKSCGNLLHVSCFSPRKYHIDLWKARPCKTSCTLPHVFMCSHCTNL